MTASRRLLALFLMQLTGLISAFAQQPETVKAAAAVNSKAAEEKSGIKIRVHVPFPERLQNESYGGLVIRIENRGKQTLPLFTDVVEGPENLLQFRTLKDGEAAPEVPVSNWEEINRLADGKVGPGQAVEFLRVKGTLPERSDWDGNVRFSLQIGQEEVVYSNAVTLKTLPPRDPAEWPVIATVQIFPGETGVNEFLAASVSGERWLFVRPVFDRSIFRRLLPLPEGETPRIVGDIRKSQVAILFEKHPEAARYYNGNLGLSRSTPWPDDNDGTHFLNRPMPADAPSPLEFPLSLFGDGRPDKPVVDSIPPRTPPQPPASR